MVIQADPCVLRGVPEFFETTLGECLQARTESLTTFRELGPPDLCHVVKTNPKSTISQIGSYHFVLGVDASSSATFSAYLNSLTYMLGLAGGKANPWKITGGTYCCFNAFSRVDLRVDIKIPGGVEAYVIDLRGDKHEITNSAAIWQETYVSAVLRAIHDDQMEEGVEPLLGLRKLDPLPTIKLEKRFLEAAAAEYFKGWQLGSKSEVQVPTVSSNHLVDGILKYFTNAGRLHDASAFFSTLFVEDPEVGAVLAQTYLGSDEELKAVKVMYEASQKFPVPYYLLIVQAGFLCTKKQYDKALRLAKLAVTRAPSEYIVWEKLAEIYMEIEDYESALLSLNSCPMFTFTEKDAHRLPAPARVHLPLKPDPATLTVPYDPKTGPNHHGTLAEENDPREAEVHPELKRLPSLTLRGTFSRAYKILTKIAHKVGWDELLKYRSKVFVMEDEYRIHRAIAEEESQNVTTQLSKQDEEEELTMENISLDDNNSDTSPKKKGRIAIDDLVKKASANPNLKNAFEQPGATRVANNPRLPFTGVNFTFKHKRLCEKWLDNLFMVLYNDLRIFTALKQELGLYKKELQTVTTASTSNMNISTHRKTAAEWEIFANLSLRLHKIEDAKDALKISLDQRLSTQALLTVTKLYAEEGNITPCLQCVVRLVSCLERTFNEEVYPSPVASSIFKLISINGLAKVQNALVALNVPQSTYRNIT
ncbi:hypothetical protein HDV04_002469 [Boothiomyces sp. JEL0838]|nr:hypothetical protein HDV04_002469 [Boothiomyces sp. JEL0838]